MRKYFTKNLFEEDESGLTDLQIIHDIHFENREKELENFAATYGINYTGPRK